MGDLLIGKGAMAKSISKETKLTSKGHGIYRPVKGNVRAGYGNNNNNNNNNNKMDF